MQALRINERFVGDVTVLELDGKLTIGEGTALLKDKVNSLVVQRRLLLLLDLGRVSYIDSGGLGQIAASYTTVTKLGGSLKLLNVGKRSHDLLSLTRLITLFETFATEPEAIGSFQPKVPVL
jgi:anti-sigma B factor antagonist